MEGNNNATYLGELLRDRAFDIRAAKDIRNGKIQTSAVERKIEAEVEKRVEAWKKYAAENRRMTRASIEAKMWAIEREAARIEQYRDDLNAAIESFQMKFNEFKKMLCDFSRSV